MSPKTVLSVRLTSAKAASVILPFDWAARTTSSPVRSKPLRAADRILPFLRDAGAAAHRALFNKLGAETRRDFVIARDRLEPPNEAEAVDDVAIEEAARNPRRSRLDRALASVARLFAFDRVKIASVYPAQNCESEVRREERTRIARELHDTLLQGIIAAAIHLEVAANFVPGDSAAKPPLNRATALIRQAIDECRSVVCGLRAVRAYDSFDLAEALAMDVGTAPVGSRAVVRIFVEGQPRALHSTVDYQVYLIGREALLNARRHSRARNIRLALEYSSRWLRVVVCDDGCGIDTNALARGRDEHWGITGMRERADRIGARLRIRSRPLAGTEVELTVPAQAAFLS